jgi:spermidine/putrescine transport system substrate-binding protein
MCRPDIALRNMDAIGYVSAIATPEILEAKIDPEIEGYYDLSYFFGEGADSIKIDPVQYPDRKVIERCAVIRDFTSKEDLEKALEMWSRVKGDNLNTGTLLIIGVVVLCIIGWLVMKQLNKRNNNKRKKTRR